MEIRINCSTGSTLKLSELSLYEKKLKKHSLLEINRLQDIIKEDGFSFPIAVQKVDGKNVIVDGECRYMALQELCKDGSDIDVPVYFIRGNIIKNILMTATTNHCAFRQAVINFTRDSDFDLKKYAFPEGELIDFFDVDDIDRYFEAIPVKNKKESQEQYFGLLAAGEL